MSTYKIINDPEFKDTHVIHLTSECIHCEIKGEKEKSLTFQNCSSKKLMIKH